MLFNCNLRFNPPIDWVTKSVLPEVKRPGSEADHSCPSSAAVTNEWIYTSTPGDEIKDNDMGGACGTYRKHESCTLVNGR